MTDGDTGEKQYQHIPTKTSINTFNPIESTNQETILATTRKHETCSLLTMTHDRSIIINNTKDKSLSAIINHNDYWAMLLSMNIEHNLHPIRGK